MKENTTPSQKGFNNVLDAIIIGGGPAGMAMALALKEQGVEKVLLVERDNHLGGVLNQCIHDGFGLIRLEKNLTGPEYRDVFYNRMLEKNIEFLTSATATNLISRGREIEVTVAKSDGAIKLTTRSLIIATGARERARGSILVPGTRPSGILTAGMVQNMINVGNKMPGKEVVILGSGDIGLLMARRLTLEGIKVVCVVEKESRPNGLPRNIKQCIEDFEIPMMLSSTVTKILGDSRLSGVEVSKLDSKGLVIENSTKLITCDTLIISVGLIPENEVALTAGVDVDKGYEPITDKNGRTNIDGIFVTGNARYIHDLVDQVSASAEAQALEVAYYLKNENLNLNISKKRPNLSSKIVSEIDAQARINEHNIQKEKRIKSREMNNRYEFNKDENSLVCILCPNSCVINYYLEEDQTKVKNEQTKAENGNKYKINGGMCSKGEDYVLSELVSPLRVLTSSIKVIGSYKELVSVRTTSGIPKESLMQAMDIIKNIKLEKAVNQGEIILKDFIIEGVNLIASSNSKW
jgi:NADPH-dependent 2,4-dienoyl-CoA reductase/sulfur reductase-like enzyme/CxxC motif-containing protein